MIGGAKKFPPMIPYASPTASGNLTAQAMDILRERFAKWGHNPSPAQMDGLEHLLAKLEEMANGTAKPRAYLAPRDPGIGKTQAISAFLRVLHKSPTHADVGEIIFVGRREEIWSFIRDMELPRNEFAVLVSGNEKDDKAVELNAVGNPNRSEARLLFTTQQMLDKLSISPSGIKDFCSLDKLYYKGKPRTVRIWDETAFRAQEVTLQVERIEALEKLATDADENKLRECLNTIIVGIRNNVDGVITLPDLYTEAGLNDDKIYKLCNDERLRETLSGLAVLSGNTVTVVTDKKNRTAIHYIETKAEDLKPYLITDASGRVKDKGVYGLWAVGPGDIVRLSGEITKSYTNLDGWLWVQPASKTAWKENQEELLSGVVSTIHGKAHEEEWLILYSQFSRPHFNRATENWEQVDIPAALKQRVVNPTRLHFVYWGGEEFRATNKYRHIRNVMVVSNHFLPEPVYQAYARAALRWDADVKLPPIAVSNVKRGEHASNILQGVCRGAARTSVGNDCGKCSVYIIASKSSGIPEMLRSGEIFPGAIFKPWYPTDTLPKGVAGEALGELDKRFNDSGLIEVSFSDIANNVSEKKDGTKGMDLKHFVYRITKTDVFEAGLEKRGIEIMGAKNLQDYKFRRMLPV